jgi:hypothetical protein
MARRQRESSGQPIEATTRQDDPQDGARPASAPRPVSLEDEVRMRAYYRYLERENEAGDEVSDWLEAESDVLGRHASGVDAEEKSSGNNR